MSTPASVIKVCSGVRLNTSQEHTIYFDSRSAQESYFAGKVVKTFSAYTYLRKSWDIKVESTMENARSWNYLYFTNPNEKTYYYFITNIEYVSDTTVKLLLELDVMQTYFFDYTVLPCFVEREHVDNDAIGKHVLVEDVELGEYVVNNQTNIDLGELCVLMLSTVNPLQTDQQVMGARYDGVFSGLGLFACELSTYAAIGAKLWLLDQEGKSDAIVAMWMYPKKLVKLAEGSTWDDAYVTKSVSGVIKSEGFTTSTPSKLNGYTPKNNKLLSHPYHYLYVSNNSGGAATYNYEKFAYANALSFNLFGALSPDAGVKLYPRYYKGANDNYEEGISLPSFPSCAWNQDVYKLWLAQNQSQMETSNAISALTIAGGVAGVIGGAVTYNPTAIVGGIGGIVAGGSSIAQTMSRKQDASVQPPQAKGTHSASVNTANGYHTFTLQFKSIDASHAKMIDDYFTMFGYKVNTLKVPNRRVRENWTYTKTIGCHIVGNMCSEDVTAIERIYDKGITFWVNGDSVGNYNLSNYPFLLS